MRARLLLLLLRRRRLRRLLLLGALVLGGCAEKATEIVVAVATDLAVPAAINRLALQVQYQGDTTLQLDVAWDLDPALNHRDHAVTIGLLPGHDPTRRVLITVRGLENDREAVKRQASLPFAIERIVLLRMNLLKRCQAPVTCAAAATCGEDNCQPIDIDSSQLPTYSEAEVQSVHLDGRPQDTSRPDAGGHADRSGTPPRE